MNILVAESSTAVGGQELAVLLHAGGLVRRGHHLRLILEPESAIHRMALEKGLEVVPVQMGRSSYPQAIVAFRRLLIAEQADILHVNSSRDNWIGALACRLLSPRPKLVRTRHISTPLNRNLATRLLYRRLIDQVIVTGGERTRQALIERDGLPADRVAAFPIGLDLEYFRPAAPTRDLRLELGLPSGQLLVGMISYLRSYKGHEYFVEAAAQVARRRPEATFLIVGEGPEESKIRAQIDSLGLEKRVRMLGFREDLLDVFRSLTLFVIPSVEGDTIPQALMQALAMGLPVVSTTVGSIPDVIRNGETGLVVPPRNATALAEQVDRLLGDAGLRRRIGAQGRALVERCYSLDQMLDQLEAVYRLVVKR